METIAGERKPDTTTDQVRSSSIDLVRRLGCLLGFHRHKISNTIITDVTWTFMADGTFRQWATPVTVVQCADCLRVLDVDVRGTENLVFGMGAETDADCNEMLARLGRETEVSHRNRITLRVARVSPPNASGQVAAKGND